MPVLSMKTRHQLSHVLRRYGAEIPAFAPVYVVMEAKVLQLEHGFVMKKYHHPSVISQRQHWVLQKDQRGLDKTDMCMQQRVLG
jgi:hypothetical protein